MNEKELNILTDELISSFYDLDKYKTFISLKKEIANNKELNELSNLISIKKEELKKLKGEEKKRSLIELKEYDKKYNDNPLVINYKALKLELIELISPLLDLKI